jgi:hypothetical protein
VIANILRRRRNTKEIMQVLQDVLLRINKRVVVFVDDFDRLESSSRDTQQIIAAALNQLQNLTNVQYVLCVGPMREGAGADLLKLTRFQEQMPEVSSEKVIEIIKILRDEIITKNADAYYPWSLIEHKSDDPLYYSPMIAFLNTSLSSKLVKLIRAPRQLKAVEREIREKWNGGLDGEISWYDLLLISALKVSESRVFEWIIRERDTFLEGKIRIGEPTKEEENEEKRISENQLKELIEVKTQAHFELVQNVLSGLFPNFMKISRKLSRREPQEWEQRISQKPRYGTSYFTRYTLGCVPNKEVPDQPTLRYIRDINKNGFQKKEFEQKYLNSFEKLTNDCNRFVQFSGLLPKKLAQEVCDCILDWMCDRQHWSVWELEDEYTSAVMEDVKRIMNNAGQLEYARDLRDLSLTSEETTKLNEWAKNKLKELISKDIIVAIAYARYAKDILGEKEARILLGTTLKERFFSNEDAIWEKAEGCRNYLGWILGVLQYNEDYENIREQVTGSALKKTENDKSGKFAESLVISLVVYHYPAGKPDLIDRYEFHINKEENQKTYDMDMLLPLIAKWKERKFKDPVAAKAYEYLLKEYAKELDGISPIAD